MNCSSVFTTAEHAELSSTFMVGDAGVKNRKLEPLSRDKLFLSIYESCKHRPGAITDAASLTQTVINTLVAQQDDSAISRDDVSRQTYLTLKNFDNVAATFYAAYHNVGS